MAVWDAFWELNASRPQTGWGATPIPFDYAVAYLDDHQVWVPDDRDEFIFLLQSMDVVWIEVANREAQARRDNG